MATTMFTSHPAKILAIKEGKEFTEVLKGYPELKSVTVKKDPSYKYYDRDCMVRGIYLYNRSTRKVILLKTSSLPFQQKEWSRIIDWVKSNIL